MPLNMKNKRNVIYWTPTKLKTPKCSQNKILAPSIRDRVGRNENFVGINPVEIK